MKIKKHKITSGIRRDLWLMDAIEVECFLDQIETLVDRMDPAAFRAYSEDPSRASTDPYAYAVQRGVAQIPIMGPIMHRPNMWLDYFGVSYTAITRVQEQLLGAELDDEVSAIAFVVDSPGGTITGLESLVQTIDSLTKLSSASISGQCCSAAYWVASAADTMSAEPGSTIGSIGVYSVVEDYSRMVEDKGIRVHVLRSGQHKGVGEFGAAISAEQLSLIQKKVDDAAARFTGAVQQNRGFSEEMMKSLATGETWSAEQALTLGLIDEVRAIVSTRKEEMDMSLSEKDLAAIQEKMAAMEAYAKKRDEEFAALREESKKQTAKQEALEAALSATKASAKAQIVEEAQKAGQIVPSMLAGMKAFIDASTPDELRAFVASLPVQTRSAQIGSAGSQAVPAEPSRLGHLRGATSEEQQIAAAFGVSVKAMNAADQIDVIRSDGTCVLKDGTEAKLAEVLN